MLSCQETFNKANVPAKEKRKPQTCSFCKNHGITVLKKNHKKYCENLKCKCIDCTGTKNRQTSSSSEQRLYRLSKCFLSEPKTDGKLRHEQMCRKCVIHGDPKSMRGHKKDCPFAKCPCDLCGFTVKRREFVKAEASKIRQRKNLNEGEIKAKVKTKNLVQKSSSSTELVPVAIGQETSSSQTLPPFDAFSSVQPQNVYQGVQNNSISESSSNNGTWGTDAGYESSSPTDFSLMFSNFFAEMQPPLLDANFSPERHFHNEDRIDDREFLEVITNFF